MTLVENQLSCTRSPIFHARSEHVSNDSLSGENYETSCNEIRIFSCSQSNICRIFGFGILSNHETEVSAVL